mgnify:CR=1 FL=1
MEKKLFYDYLDIMEMFEEGKDRAYAIIRSIKTCSDIMHISGKVTVSDFDKWFNMPRQGIQGIKKEPITADAAGTHCD